MGSSDDIKHEVATRDPTVHDIHNESGREDDYSTNSTKDEVPIEVIPPAGNNNIDNFYHTGSCGRSILNYVVIGDGVGNHIAHNWILIFSQ